MSTDKHTTSRRRFVTFLVAAPALTIATRLEAVAAPKGNNGQSGGGEEPVAGGSGDLGTTWTLRVGTDNKITFESPRNDNGQGISTALAMLIAEDLDARIADVSVTYADAGAASEGVGGSNSMQTMWEPARKLAAQARARLVTAAAQQWVVPASTLTTSNSTVFAPDGRTASYGSLAAAAAQLATVATAPKPAMQHRLVGTPVKQLESRDIVTGRTIYAMDVAVAGALPTVVRRPDKLARNLVAVGNTSAVLAMSGVRAVTPLQKGVAVSADTFWEALAGRNTLVVTWAPGPLDTVSDVDVSTMLNAAALPLAPVPLASNYVDGQFEFAFVNHAPMETNDAVADVRAGTAEIWCSTQSAAGHKKAIAQALGISASSVVLHVLRGGGSFGRRVYADAAVEAALVSQKIGKPVKLMWPRDDDIKHGRMRPASLHKMRISYTPPLLNGVLNIDAFQNQSSAVQLDLTGAVHPYLSQIDPGAGGTAGLGPAFFAITQVNPYELGNEVKALVDVPLAVPTGFWRSVYSGHNRAAEEMMFDLFAKKLGKDPLDLRIQLAKTAPAKALLTKLKSVSNWTTALPNGWARGVGYHEEYNSLAGCVVEMDATAEPARVTRATVVADVGVPVNPAGLEAEFMGSVMDGIATILRAGNTMFQGAIQESSFADFKWTRQRHAPLRFEAHLMPANGSIGGAGELVVPAAAGAVGNAYAKATGQSPNRKYPING